MKQKAPNAPHKMSSRDMLKMLTSRLRDFMGGASLAGVEPVDKIRERVVAGMIQGGLLLLLHEMQDEDGHGALHERDHGAVEADAEGLGDLLGVEGLLRVAGLVE